MTETNQQPQETHESPTKHSKPKPMSNQIATDLNRPERPEATRQTQARRRYSPRAPGFVPVPVDIVITMSLQLALTITNFFVILTSFAYSGDDLGWYILFEIIFTYVGFAYFVYKISRQVLVYKKFFRKLNNWHDRKLQEIADGDSSCCCLWCILVRVAWWVAALLLFPIVIFWSMYQSYQWHKDRKRVSESTVDVTQLDNVSGDKAYSVWHLGVLSKQASMITMFIQDLPLLIMSATIGNYLGIIVYSCSLLIKLPFWVKHMIDLGKLTLFYDCADYLDHFGMSGITWDYLEELNIHVIVPKFYTQWQHEMSTLQRGDWILVYIGKAELTKDTELDDNNARIMVIYESKHFKKTENLVCIDYKAVPAQVFDDYAEGKTKNIEVPIDCVHTLNRWDGNIVLLRDEMFEKYHDNEGDDTSNSNKHEIEEQAPVEVITTNGTEVANNSSQVSNRNTQSNEDFQDVQIEMEGNDLENAKENGMVENGNNYDIQNASSQSDADNDETEKKPLILKESHDLIDDKEDNNMNTDSRQYEPVAVDDDDEQDKN